MMPTVLTPQWNGMIVYAKETTMMPTVLTPDTGMLIDDLTPTPATPHNLIRPRGDIYDGLKTHGLLDTEQANHLWDWLDDYDLELRLAVAPDGRVFHQGHAKDDANQMAAALDSLRLICGNMESYGGANPDEALKSAMLWQSALLGVADDGGVVAVFDLDACMFAHLYDGMDPLTGYVALKAAMIQNPHINEEGRS